MIIDTSSDWLMMLLLCSLKWLPLANSSFSSSSTLLILATVTMANLPRWQLMMMGCASVSLMTPIPELPENSGSSASNFERKYEFSIL